MHQPLIRLHLVSILLAFSSNYFSTSPLVVALQGSCTSTTSGL